MMMREILQWSSIDQEKKDIGSWSMIKHWRISSFSEEFFRLLISMNRRRHPMLVNDQTLGNVLILTEIPQWCDLHENEKSIARCSVMKHWQMFSSWEKFFDDLIPMAGERTSDASQWSNIAHGVHPKRNSSLISPRWRRKGHRIMANHQTLRTAGY